MIQLLGRGVWDLEDDSWRNILAQLTADAAQATTQLGQHLELVLVQARAEGRWAFIAWRRPDLILAHVPCNTWRVYRIDGSFTPTSRFAGSEGLPSTGLVGQPVRLGQFPPPTVEKLLAMADTDHADLLRRLTD